mgnify:CR=1 FL=1
MNLEFVPSTVLKRVFVAAVTLSLTASPSLSGLLCGGSHKAKAEQTVVAHLDEGDGSDCLLYTSPSPRDGLLSRMPSSS